MAQWDDTLQSILNDPQTMGQLFSIAQSITGNSDTPDPVVAPTEEQAFIPLPDENPLSTLGGLSDIDPKLLSLGLSLLSTFGQEDNRSATLLSALKPYLSEKHLRHMDKAIQITKYVRLLSTAYGIVREERGSEERGQAHV